MKIYALFVTMDFSRTIAYLLGVTQCSRYTLMKLILENRSRVISYKGSFHVIIYRHVHREEHYYEASKI